MSKLELPTLARRSVAIALVFCAAVLPKSALAAGSRTDPLHVWVGGDDPAALEAWVGERLATAQRAVDRLLAVKGKRTVANTLQAYDDAQNALNLAANEAHIIFAVGATAPLRDRAQALNQKASSALTDLSLNQGVYRALAAVPLPADDPPTRNYLERTLLEYRLAGVDRDDATRARIRALQDRITELSLTFNRTVQDSVLKVEATRAELEGLPEDYIARHPPGAEGRYVITTDEPDVGPVLNFAASADLRRRVYLAYNGRAYPANRQVLLDLLAARSELATVLVHSFRSRGGAGCSEPDLRPMATRALAAPCGRAASYPQKSC
jgi:thimet oligopeptidase